jgi:hypothetical protein
MNQFNLYKLSLLVSIPLNVIGALFKIMHWPGASLCLWLGLLMSLPFILIAFATILQSKDLTVLEKGIWVLGFVIFPPLVGLVYYFKALKPTYKSQ